MMFRFIIWMILVYIAGKIIGRVILSLRRLMTPNKNISGRGTRSAAGNTKNIEDIPYEEVKDDK